MEAIAYPSMNKVSRKYNMLLDCPTIYEWELKNV